MNGWYVSETKFHRLRNGELILTSICVEEVNDETNTGLKSNQINEYWGKPAKIIINGKYIGQISVSAFWAIPVSENSDILSAGVLFTKPEKIDRIPFIEEMKLNNLFGRCYILEGANKSYKDNRIFFT